MLALFFATLVMNSHAIKPVACNSYVVNGGLWKRYQYMGFWVFGYMGTAKATQAMGSTKASGVTSVESTTFTLDPGTSTKFTTAHTQSSSSWGQCSLFGNLELQSERDRYVALNLEQVQREIAAGGGESVTTLAAYMGCNRAGALGKALQSNYDLIFPPTRGQSLEFRPVEMDRLAREVCQ